MFWTRSHVVNSIFYKKKQKNKNKKQKLRTDLQIANPELTVCFKQLLLFCLAQLVVHVWEAWEDLSNIQGRLW